MMDRKPQQPSIHRRLCGWVLFIAALGLFCGPGPARAAPQSFCGGASVPLRIEKSGVPIARLALDGHEADFLIDTGSTMSILDANALRVRPGRHVTMHGFTLPTVTEGSFEIWSWLPHGRSIIGTDILRTRTVEIHYDSSDSFLALSDGPCAADTLKAAGFARIDQHGHYATLAVDPKPALPVVFVRIGGVTKPFFLDTGRGIDSHGGGYDGDGFLAVNEPYFDLLKADGISTRPVATTRLMDCRGHDTEMDVLSTEGTRLSIVGRDGGKDLASYDTPPLMVLPVGSLCGTIAVQSQTFFGLIGSSFLHKWGTVIINPFSEAVWIKLG